jgi:hypothetical protein
VRDIKKLRLATLTSPIILTTITHAYDPNYSGGRDQEDSSPGQIVLETLSQKYPTQKRAAEWLKQLRALR